MDERHATAQLLNCDDYVHLSGDLGVSNSTFFFPLSFIVRRFVRVLKNCFVAIALVGVFMNLVSELSGCAAVDRRKKI